MNCLVSVLDVHLELGYVRNAMGEGAELLTTWNDVVLRKGSEQYKLRTKKNCERYESGE